MLLKITQLDYATAKKKETRKKNYTDTGGLPYELSMRVGARVLLTTNIDISDRLVNGQLGTVKHIKVSNERCENRPSSVTLNSVTS